MVHHFWCIVQPIFLAICATQLGTHIQASIFYEKAGHKELHDKERDKGIKELLYVLFFLIITIYTAW